MSAFIEAHPVATGVMFVTAICAIAFVALLGKWASAPTSDPHAEPHGDVPNVGRRN